MTKCHFYKETNKRKLYLRRIVFSKQADPHTHQAMVYFSTDNFELTPEGHLPLARVEDICPKTDERWKQVAKCEKCDYLFQESDYWDIFQDVIYHDDETNQEFGRRELPPGAMYFAPWLDSLYKPQLEHNLVVVLPNGIEWNVDSQANNCTIPDDTHQDRHHCWVISGTMPNITAGKNQPTCSAGAGSIQAGDYHGHLINGELT